MAGNVHARNVLSLYKVILRLHERLPLDLKTLGDLYVKSEFKQHKNCAAELVPQFMQQWTAYAAQLHQQLETSSSEKTDVGQDIPVEGFDRFSKDQLLQLVELMKETTKENRQFNVKDPKD